MKNKVAVVAGGANRAGRAIAERLAEAGARVIVADLNLINAEVVVQAIIDRYNTEATAISFNTESNAVVSTIQAIEENWGPIEIWINANAVFLHHQALPMDGEGTGLLMDYNAKGIFFSCKEVAAHMISGGKGGIIVNIVPVSDLDSPFALSDASAVQEGIAAFTRKFSEELSKHGISLFAVAPVSIKKPLYGNADSEVSIEYAMPDDVGRLVLFCISNLAHIMTGKVITLNRNKIFIELNH